MDIESKLSTKQKGDVVENRVSEIITLSSQGRLTCFSPNTDDDGIDLIVNRKGYFTPIFLQIKGRFALTKGKCFIQNVNINTFRPHKNFFILFVYFDSNKLEVDTLWLVPSSSIISDAIYLKEGEHYKASYRFNASFSTNNVKWSEYKINKSELGNKIDDIINDLYPQR